MWRLHLGFAGLLTGGCGSGGHSLNDNRSGLVLPETLKFSTKRLWIIEATGGFHPTDEISGFESAFG